jgi:hypothetical protein
MRGAVPVLRVRSWAGVELITGKFSLLSYLCMRARTHNVTQLSYGRLIQKVSEV